VKLELLFAFLGVPAGFLFGFGSGAGWLGFAFGFLFHFLFSSVNRDVEYRVKNSIAEAFY
jgi:hypothetical protein